MFGNYVSAVGTKKQSRTEKCVDSAFETFATTYPNWVDADFDQTFIDETIKPLVNFKWNQGRLPSAVDVSMAWDKQFHADNFDTRKNDLNSLTQAANLFVNTLARQLG